MATRKQDCRLPMAFSFHGTPAARLQTRTIGKGPKRVSSITCAAHPAPPPNVPPLQVRVAPGLAHTSNARREAQTSLRRVAAFIRTKSSDKPSKNGLSRKLVVAGIISASAAIALGGFVGFMVLIQDRLVYKPSRKVRGSPQDFGFPVAYPTTIFTTDNATLKGWFLPAPSISGTEQNVKTSSPNRPRPPTVLYFHGRDKNASFRLGKAKALVDHVDCNLLLLSYRGFGESAPNRFPTEPGMCRDGEAAMRHLAYLARQGQVDPTKIWIYGESLGGGVAVHIAKKYGPIRVRGLILENTFTSLLDMIDKTSPVFSVFKPLSRNRWTNAEKIVDLKMPILFLSGLRDAFIPPRMMKELYTKATNSANRELVEFPDGTHNRTWMMQGYFENIRQFIERVGDRESSKKLEPTSRV